MDLFEESSVLVRRLWDVEMIKQLKARYFRFLDTRDWEALRTLFTDDCTYDAPGMPDTRGGDAFVTRVAKLFAGAVTVHHGHMPEITVDSHDTASGIWSMVDYIQLDPSQPSTWYTGYGYYYETYLRISTGEWLISSWRLARSRIDRPTSGGE